MQTLRFCPHWSCFCEMGQILIEAALNLSKDAFEGSKVENALRKLFSNYEAISRVCTWNIVLLVSKIPKLKREISWLKYYSYTSKLITFISLTILLTLIDINNYTKL